MIGTIVEQELNRRDGCRYGLQGVALKNWSPKLYMGRGLPAQGVQQQDDRRPVSPTLGGLRGPDSLRDAVQQVRPCRLGADGGFPALPWTEHENEDRRTIEVSRLGRS